MRLPLSRRQVLKSGLAGIVTASFPLGMADANPMPQLDLSHFCTADAREKYETSGPWINQGHRYATDCFICIRTKSSQPNTRLPSHGLRYPDCDQLPWHEIQEAASWKPWPQQPLKGTGDSQHYAILIGALLVQTHYNRLLRRLPCLRYSVARNTSLGEVFLLRFQGGEGLLMPMDP